MPRQQETDHQTTMTTNQYTVVKVTEDQEGYTTLELEVNGTYAGVVSDHPSLEGEEGSHFFAGASSAKVGEIVTL